MTLKHQIELAGRLARPYCVTHGKHFRLNDFDPGDTGALKAKDKPKAQAGLRQGIETLAQFQDMLYAQDRWAVLLIFQAMDAAGKDSAIKHVMSGLNPQGCHVVSFKTPSSTELAHDFLWRCARQLPQRGRIGIFNRSYYEETLVVRVHPNLLPKQKLPEELLGKDIWKQRFQDIRAFESYLGHNGVVVRKFFLYLSREEQKRRFLERIEQPAKHWKFSGADAYERGFWKDYMAAYEDMIAHTATEQAPWYVVPADHKWYARIVVAAAIGDTLASLNLHYPKVTPEQLRELARARKQLVQEK